MLTASSALPIASTSFPAPGLHLTKKTFDLQDDLFNVAMLSEATQELGTAVMRSRSLQDVVLRGAVKETPNQSRWRDFH